MYWKAPTENLICGDVDGNIAWQASALTPNRAAPAGSRDRRSWVGRLPVPGTGAYEWEGFRADLPREFNPARGFIATANNQIQPKEYTPPMMFKSSNNIQFERITRLRQMIQPGKTYTPRRSSRDAARRVDAERAAGAAAVHGLVGVTAERRARAADAREHGMPCSRATASRRRSTRRGGRSRRRRSATPRGRSRSARPLHEASLAKAIEQLTSTPGRGLGRLALGPHAHADVPASARERLQSADDRAARRHRHGRRRRRDLSRNPRRRRTGIDRSSRTCRGSQASRRVRSTATCCRCSPTMSIFRSCIRGERVEKETAHQMTIKPGR